MAFNVQGSVTVRRLRTGATISLMPTVSMALQQQVNVDSGEVTPDWTIEANQPVITPQASSSNGGTVTMQNGSWTYNGSELDFSGSSTTSEGWIIDSSGKFAMDNETFALRIIDNLASETNYANDTLVFTVQCWLEGNYYWLSWSTNINIVQAGATGYNGQLYVTPTKTLTAQVTQTDIMAQLFSPAGIVSGFYTTWWSNYVGGELIEEKKHTDGTTYTLMVDRDMVNGGDSDEDPDRGGTLFICQYFLEQTDTSPVATSAVSIADVADEFTLMLQVTSDNQELAEDKPVEVTAYIYSNTEGADVTTYCTVNKWALSVLNPDLSIKRTVDDRTIKVDMGDSIDDADVNVVGEVEFTYNK